MVPNTTRRAGPFVGNGVTVTFAFTFKVTAKSDLRVVKLVSGVQSDLVLDSDYTVALNADQEASPGGSITTTVIYTATTTLTILSNLPTTQTADLPNLGAFYPTVVEDALDRAIMLIGQLQEVLTRTITLQASTSGVAVELPTPSANLAIGWNSTGTALANIASLGALTVTGFGNTLINAANAAAARTILSSTAVGDALFTAATAAAARATLGLGTAAVLDVGTGASQVVQLTAAAKLPAVDGSLLTGLSAAPPGAKMFEFINLS